MENKKAGSNFFINNYKNVKSKIDADKQKSESRIIKQADVQTDSIKKPAFTKLSRKPPPSSPSYSKKHLAALYLISSGIANAREVVRSFSKKELAETVKQMKAITSLTEEDIRAVELSFGPVDRFNLKDFTNGTDYVTRLLYSLKKPDSPGKYFIKDEVKTPPVKAGKPEEAVDDTPLSFMNTLKPEQVHELLAEESKLIISIILGMMESKRAAEILKLFPPVKLAGIVKLMSRKKEISPQVLDTIIEKLKTNAQRFEEDKNSIPVMGKEKLIEILKHSTLQDSNTLMRDLEIAVPDIADEIKEKLFTFEDIPSIPKRSLQTALKTFDYRDIAFMLKGADDTIKDFFYSCITKKRTQLIKEEIDLMGKVKKRDVDEKRKEFLQYLKDLEDKGTIILKHDDVIS